jgi:hypothetical protein
MITAVLVPADEEAPLEKVEIDEGDLSVFQRYIEGNVQAINIYRPDSSLWCDEDGKDKKTPMNRRATLLLWLHATHFRSLDYIAGPTLITGRPVDGVTTSISDELVKLFFNTSAYRIEVQTADSESWNSNEMWFADWVSAYNYGLNLANRWLAVLHVRVVPV